MTVKTVMQTLKKQVPLFTLFTLLPAMFIAKHLFNDNDCKNGDLETEGIIASTILLVITLIWSGFHANLSLNNEFLRWKYTLKQIRIKESSQLPPGCLITDDEEEVERVLALKRKTEEVIAFDVVSESDEDEITNELLD